MKAGKAPGPSGIVLEMIRAASDMWSVTSQLHSIAVARYPLTGSIVSLSASTRVKGMHWKGKTTMVSSWQSRSWKSWRGLWTASSDSWCQLTIPSLASSQAEAQQMQSLCPCWGGVQWRVWSESQCSPRLGTQLTALHHYAWGLVMRVLLWGPLGGPLCRWPCYHRWIARGLCQEAIDLERSNGGERTESKCRKDEDHDLWYGPGRLAEQASFHVLSVALEWAATASSAMTASTGCTRNAVGSSAWQRSLITDVHGARELHATWMADHRRKSRSDLTSWKW